jgi:hypothetical protein
MKSIAVALVILSAASVRAEVKTEEKSQMKFPGMLGRVMGVFGGKAMREGMVDTVAVKGNRKLTINDETGRLVDLDEEKVYDFDMKAKTYTVKTFDDLRREMEQAQERGRNERKKPDASATSEPRNSGKQMAMDFDLKETGQKRNINGYDCREVIMTITVREKDKTLEQAGGMVMTTHEWLAPRIDAMKEIAEFDRRYAEKLQGPSFAIMPSADQIAVAAQTYPMLTDAIGKFNVENVNMDGTPILTVMTTESVASPEELERQQREARKSEPAPETTPTSVGGLLGGIGRRAMRSREQKQQQPENATPGRATVMTMNHEVIRVATDVSAADVSIPAGFKQKR